MADIWNEPRGASGVLLRDTRLEKRRLPCVDRKVLLMTTKSVICRLCKSFA